MSVREPMLTDEQWEKIRQLIFPRPPRPKVGPPPADDRACFEGILWILKTGARWKDLPDEYPHPLACWRRLRQWYEDNVLMDMWRAFLSELDHEGILKWDELFVDGSFFPAKKGARQSEKPSGERERSAWYWSMARVFLSEAISRQRGTSPAEITLLDKVIGNDREIEFVFWGEFKLRRQLLDMGDRGAGYIRYWLDERILTAEWFCDRFEETKRDADPRYTPEIHVDLPLCFKFDAFGRTCSFPDTIAGHYDQLLRRWNKALWVLNSGLAKDLTEPVGRLGPQMENLVPAINFAGTEPFHEIDLDQMLTLASEAMRETSHSIDIVRRTRDGMRDGQGPDRNSVSELENSLFELQYALDDFVQFYRQKDLNFANSRALLLSGKAGTGKTHLPRRSEN